MLKVRLEKNYPRKQRRNLETEQLSKFCTLQIQQCNEVLNTKTHQKSDYENTDSRINANFKFVINIKFAKNFMNFIEYPENLQFSTKE